MSALDEENSPNKTDVEIRTRNPVHEYHFKWNIDNATKFSRRLNSHQFPQESDCKPRFRLVAKFHEKYPDISNVNIGLQRIDDGKEIIHVGLDISLVNTKGVVYRHKRMNYTTGTDGSPCYIFSELFTTDRSKLKFITSFSCDDSLNLSEALKNNLEGSYKHEKEVFILPCDVFIVKGTIKSHGCCVVTETLAPKQILDEDTQKNHVSQLLMDIQTSYEENHLTDVELIVDEDAIRVHRFILSLRSPVFRRMFEHDTKEKTSGKVYITDVEKKVLENFVWYLYTGIIKEEAWDFMGSLYSIAEKYEVFPLKKACIAILSNQIDTHSVCGILELADLYNDEDLKTSAMDYLVLYFSKIKSNPEWDSIINNNQKLAAEVLTEVSSYTRGELS